MPSEASGSGTERSEDVQPTLSGAVRFGIRMGAKLLALLLIAAAILWVIGHV